MSCEHVCESLLESLEEPGNIPAGLRAHLEGCPACQSELEQMQETWAALGRLEGEHSNDRMRGRFYAMLAAESIGQRAPGPAPAHSQDRLFSWWTRRPVLHAGLLTATMLAGVLLGTWFGLRWKGQGELEELRAEMRSMSQIVTMSLLHHQSASERLRAIGLCEATPLDDGLVQALLRVVKDDPSANVRLAALDLLASMPARPDVRDGLIESFPHQESPPVTAAMASLLLKLDGQVAVDAVRAAADDDRLPETVRQYLRRILAEKSKAMGTGT